MLGGRGWEEANTKTDLEVYLYVNEACDAWPCGTVRLGSETEADLAPEGQQWLLCATGRGCTACTNAATLELVGPRNR